MYYARRPFSQAYMNYCDHQFDIAVLCRLVILVFCQNDRYRIPNSTLVAAGNEANQNMV